MRPARCKILIITSGTFLGLCVLLISSFSLMTPAVNAQIGVGKLKAHCSVETVGQHTLDVVRCHRRLHSPSCVAELDPDSQGSSSKIVEIAMVGWL